MRCFYCGSDCDGSRKFADRVWCGECDADGILNRANEIWKTIKQ